MKKDKRLVSVAAIQCALSDDIHSNNKKIAQFVKEAAHKGAQIILPSELFQGHYWCKEEKDIHFSRAYSLKEHPSLSLMSELAKELKVAIPVSIFEKDGPHYFNSLVMLDADGRSLGLYRKSHIPDGPGYEEKFYFRPGDTGFQVWKTRYADVGVGICWDQWFPECARSLMLLGAELLFYPTAIGSEPEESELNTKDPWQRAMIGHAVSNVVPVIAANRIGVETTQSFYGHSFIADQRGNKVQEFTDKEEGVLLHTFDLNEVEMNRASFGFFRDRRPDLYGLISAPKPR